MDHADAIERTWAAVELWLRGVLNLFGTAAELMARGWIVRSERRRLLVFLRTAEAMARRLLMERARDLPPENDPPRRLGVGRASGGFGRGGFASEDPADWSVRFRHLAPRSPWAGSRRAPRRTARRPVAPNRLFAALPIAERIEALTRVIADPDRYARRLARRLKRRTPLSSRPTRSGEPGPRPGWGSTRHEVPVRAFGPSGMTVGAMPKPDSS